MYVCVYRASCRYWCYQDPAAYANIELLPIRTTGDCFDPHYLLPCGMTACYCYADHASAYAMTAPHLYEMLTQEPWPVTHPDSWMVFVDTPPVAFASTFVVIGGGGGGGGGIRIDFEHFVGSDDTTIYYSAITYHFRQNYCQQVPSALLTIPTPGDGHSPYPSPLWDGDMEGYQDSQWVLGRCTERGFPVLQSVTLMVPVAACGTEASWVAENEDSLTALHVNTSRLVYIT
jgi:hypothetical protein